MEADKSGRLRVLPDVSVARLEAGLDSAFGFMQHRSVERCVQGLESMTWKTALTGHLEQVVALEPIMFQLLTVCSNGLLPHKMLADALAACHKSNPLQMHCPRNAPPNWESATLSYFMLRLRMIAGKLRDVCGSSSLWAQVQRKCSSQQAAVILRLCRVMRPTMTATAARVDDSPKDASPLEDTADVSDEKIELQFLQLQAVPAEAGDCPAAPAAPKPSPSFLARATQRALDAAMSASPCKPLTKVQRAAEDAAAQTSVLKKPSSCLKRPAAAQAAPAPKSLKRPAAAPEPAETGEDVESAAAQEPAETGEDVESAVAPATPPADAVERVGCSKCRSTRVGCARCRRFAAEKYNRYIKTRDGSIVQLKAL